jgi:hypothetical protein
MVENNKTKVYRCDECDKNYKDKTGLWYHNNKYHNINSPKIANQVEKPVILVEKPAKTPPNNVKTNLVDTKLICEFCNFIFTRKDSLIKHYGRCKIKKENNSEKKIIEQLKNQIMEMQLQLSDVLKYAKIHPKTLQKINKNLINGNNNTLNSGTVNNIQIVKFGSEDIKSILSTKEIKNILNCRYKAIEESIKKVHFNDDRPEYRNIYITNLRDNIAYVYNGNKFEAVQKHSIINQLIDQHMNNIEVSLEDYKNKLPERTVEILDKLIEKLQDEHTSMIDEENNKEFKNYRLFKINEVKLMIYNETGNNTEVIKLKYNNSIFNKPIKEIDV